MCLHPDIIDALAAAGATGAMIAAACRAAWAVERSAAPRPAQAPAQAPGATNLAAVPDNPRSVVGAPNAAASHSGSMSMALDPRDARRESARLRQKRKRDADRAAAAQMDMFPVSLASVTGPRDGVTGPRDIQTSARAPTSLSFLESKKEEGGGGGGTRATPLVLISPEAIEVADEVATIAGLDPADRMATPPGWCGAAARVQTWLAHWPRETILAGARAGMASKRDGPPETPRYFEKPIARIHLQLSAPVPQAPEVSYARVRERRPATDWQSRRDNWHAARAELDAAVAAYGGS